MGWCNYIVDKPNRLAFPLGKLGENEFLDKCDKLSGLVDKTEYICNTLLDSEKDLVDTPLSLLTVEELYRLVLAYKAILSFGAEEMSYRELVAASYYIGQQLSGNILQFYTEDEYAKECASGFHFTVVGY